MLKRILKLVLPLILTISVVVPQTYARLGDEEEAVVSRNKAAAIHTDSYAESNFKTYVFQYTKGFYSVLIVDGKVEAETYAVWDKYSFPSELLSNELSRYGDKWNEVDSVLENTKTFRTVDGEYYAVIGEMKQLKVKKSVTFFTRKWRESGNTKI